MQRPGKADIIGRIAGAFNLQEHAVDSDRQMVAAKAPAGRAARPGSPVAVALLAWGVLAILMAIKTVAAPDIHSVFPTFAESARNWWAERPLYVHQDGFGAFRYAPSFSVLLMPFAALGLRIGGIAWAWLNIAVFVWGLRRLARHVLPGAWPAEREAAFLLLAMPGAIRGIWNAQSNGLMAGLLLVGAAMLMQRRFWSAAWALALSALKVTPLAPIMLLVALRPRKLIAPLAVALAAVLVLPWLTQSPGYVRQQYAEWLGHLTGSTARRWPGFRDAWTVWETLAGSIWLPGYRAMQAGGGLAVLAWSLWQQRRQADPRTVVSVTLAMGIAYLMLFGPATESSTYTWLAPLAAWGLMESLDRRIARPIMIPAFLLTTLGTFGSIERALGRFVPGAALMLPIGSALLMLWLVLYGRASTRLVCHARSRSVGAEDSSQG